VERGTGVQYGLPIYILYDARFYINDIIRHRGGLVFRVYNNNILYAYWISTQHRTDNTRHTPIDCTRW